MDNLTSFSDSLWIHSFLLNLLVVANRLHTVPYLNKVHKTLDLS